MKASMLLAAAGVASAAPSAQHARRAACSDVRDLSVTREGSALLLDGKPWSAVGGNIYWLGLDENVTPPAGEPYYAPLKASYPTKGRITEAMAVTKAMGGTAIRAHTLGVSTGNPLSLMPALGTVNPAAFDTIDWAVYQAREYGLRLMVPLTDNFDYYHGGKYNFLRWHGISASSTDPAVQQFYTNATIIASFKDYIHTLLTHVNQYTNISYADDPTIFAYETGNELCGPVWGDMNVPASWVQQIGAYVKSLAPKKLFVDGTYGVNREHLSIAEVDIFSDHYYPISLSKLKGDLALGESSPPSRGRRLGSLDPSRLGTRKLTRNPSRFGEQDLLCGRIRLGWQWRVLRRQFPLLVVQGHRVEPRRHRLGLLEPVRAQRARLHRTLPTSPPPFFLCRLRFFFILYIYLG